MEYVVQVSASLQDGYTLDSVIDRTGNEAYVGSRNAGVPPLYNYKPADTYLFFEGVATPRGARLISVTLEVVADGGGNGDPTLRVYANDVDDAVIPADGADHDGKVRTTASVAWNPGTWVAGTTYSPGDLKMLLQEVIDRPGWRPMNNFMLLIDDDGSTDDHWRPIRTYDDTPGDAAILTIVYTVTRGMALVFD